MVANSLFLTGASTGQETSKKKESRKEDGSNRKHRKGNKRQEENHCQFEGPNATSAKEDFESS
jgi:hypothetical protein